MQTRWISIASAKNVVNGVKSAMFGVIGAFPVPFSPDFGFEAAIFGLIPRQRSARARRYSGDARDQAGFFHRSRSRAAKVSRGASEVSIWIWIFA